MELTVIQSKIYEIRGSRVMLDFDLATLYQVETRRLNESVKRNIKRFPADFMFQLTEKEWTNLRRDMESSNLMSQFATSSWGGTRKLPYAFTEQGVAMLSGLLNSDVAINVNIAIMRAFVMMRNYLNTTTMVNSELVRIWEKLEALERNDEYSLGVVNDLSEDLRKEISDLYLALGELSARPAVDEKPRRKIGFNRD